MKTGGHDAKRAKFHLNVAIKLHIICTYKKKHMRELLLCLMTSMHVKNYLKNVQKCRKLGRSKCKKSCGETKQRIHKDRKKIM